MIVVDNRVGSKELNGLFTIPTELRTIPFGDFAFFGKGPKGKVHIGVERKQIRDLIDSVMSGRLWGHQIPGMIESYDYSYLVIEGVYKLYPEYIMVPTGKKWIRLKIGSKILNPFLNSVQILTGMMINYTTGKRTTVQMVEDLYRWWQKEFNEHGAYGPYQRRSHLPDKCSNGAMVYMVSRCLPGIGLKRADSIRKHFNSVVEMVNANDTEWESIPLIGKKQISDIREAIGYVEDVER